jgi:hypothetical protein
MKTKTPKPEPEIYQNPLAWWGETQEKSLTLAKWMALYEAVNLIADKAEEKNISMNEVEFKPLEIRDYMNSTQDIYLRKILEEDYKINICYNEDASVEIKKLFPEIDIDLLEY